MNRQGRQECQGSRNRGRKYRVSSLALLASWRFFPALAAWRSLANAAWRIRTCPPRSLPFLVALLSCGTLAAQPRTQKRDPGPDPALVRQLIGRLGHDRFTVRVRATESLVRMGARILPHLERELARTKDLEVRTRLVLIRKRIQGSGSVLLSRLRALVKKRRFREALQLAGQAIRADPRNPDAHLARALVWEGAGSLPRATADCDRAIQLAPGRVAAWLVRGRIRARRGHLAAARADLDAALRINPRDASIYVERAGVLLRLGRSRDALADLDRGLALDPGNGRGHSGRGEVYLRLGMSWQAIAAFTKAIALAPALAEAHVGRGRARSRVGDLRGALADLRSAVRLAPSSGEAWYELGLVLGRLGDRRGALEALRRVRTLAPKMTWKVMQAMRALERRK